MSRIMQANSGSEKKPEPVYRWPCSRCSAENPRYEISFLTGTDRFSLCEDCFKGETMHAGKVAIDLRAGEIK